MTDHAEINQFFEEIIHILLEVRPQHADITEHVDALMNSIIRHAGLGDKYAEALYQLTKTDIEAMLRFVERPHGRHHLAEIEKMKKDLGAEAAGRLFLKHFYDHNKNHLIHAEKLKHISKH
ncbi:MAG: hypothetical protein ABIF92_01050 [archaeon]